MKMHKASVAAVQSVFQSRVYSCCERSAEKWTFIYLKIALLFCLLVSKISIPRSFPHPLQSGLDFSLSPLIIKRDSQNEHGRSQQARACLYFGPSKSMNMVEVHVNLFLIRDEFVFN